MSAVGQFEFFYAAVASSDGIISATIGFAPNHFVTELENIPEDYPYFQLTDCSEKTPGEQAAVWEQHFRSLLSFLSGRPQFLEALVAVHGIDAEYMANPFAADQ